MYCFSSLTVSFMSFGTIVKYVTVPSSVRIPKGKILCSISRL